MIKAVFNPITILLAVMSLQWVVITEVGAFTLMVPYLALLIVALLAPFSPRRLEAAYLFIRQNAMWFLPVALYLLIVLPILQGTPAATFTPRQIFYLMCSVGFAAFVATSRNIGRIFRVGAAVGLVVLIGFVELLAGTLGLSWIDAIERFFGGGDLNFVVYSFFRPIFNSLDPTGDSWVSASRKNDVAGCVLVLAILFRSGSARPESDFRGMLFMGAAIGLLVMMNDRSVLIAAAASLLIATILGAVMRPVRNTPLLVAKLILLLVAFVIAVALAFPESGFFGTLSERFSFGDRSTEARLEQFSEALAIIQEHPFAGSGYFEVAGYAIHNAFLAAWAYAGIAAFVLVVCFYIGVFMRWLTFLLSTARRPQRWVLPLAPEWLATLAVMPLFRLWLGAEAGILKFPEWIALAAFFGCLLGNDLRRRSVKRLIAWHRWKLAEAMGARNPALESRR